MNSTEQRYADKQDFLKQLGETYGDIRILNENGGGGIIYTAVHSRLGNRVVLKQIRSKSLSLIGKDREISILRELKHTYLPQIYDFWSYKDEVYTVMEYIDGKSLEMLLQEGRRFSQREVIRLTKQLAEVLVYLHNSPLHLVHSDIKPANIMLTPDNNICLIDFNISILDDGRSDDTIGYTPGYAPPEQLIRFELDRRKRSTAAQTREIKRAELDEFKTTLDEGIALGETHTDLADSDRTAVDDDKTMLEDQPPARDASNVAAPARERPIPERVLKLMDKYGRSVRVDARSDIYSACATMYHLLTGHAPLPCDSKQIPIEKYLPNVNDAFAKILRKGLSQDPDKRYRNAETLLKALNGLEKSTKKFKRLRFAQDLVILLLVMMIAVGVVGGYAGLRMKLASRAEGLVSEATGYYLRGDYKAAVDSLGALFDNPIGASDRSIAEAYYVMGCCALQAEKYEDACDSLRRAIISGSARPEYYRDYGIALVGSGNVSDAEECLAQARSLGISDDSLLLLDGEIRSAAGDYGSARELLTDCVSGESEPMVKVRAAMELDRIAERFTVGQRELDDRIERLGYALELVNGEGALKLPLKERLAQLLMDCAAETGIASYTERAIEVLDSIIEAGYASISEMISKAECLRSLKRFTEALEVLENARSAYPSSYLIFKTLAFLEIDRQYSLGLSERDYSDFDRYYRECVKLYSAEPHFEQDLELDVLKRTYEEAVEKGWLVKTE